ncbi:hypothetical protein EVAR_68719_1 [Eumeta japonica]|uniref:Uncharacterized protein n=1 Tax=Eumeta variegata TaxID=151549 RepID=A0A4C2A0H8_EUMVA|nr:hypothetical protein EVAR_68719_1 [Eumeta japonica]
MDGIGYGSETIPVRNEELEFANATVFLGISFDNRHQWGPYITKLLKKLSSAVYAIKKIRHLLDIEAARLADGLLIICSHFDAFVAVTIASPICEARAEYIKSKICAVHHFCPYRKKIALRSDTTPSQLYEFIYLQQKPTARAASDRRADIDACANAHPGDASPATARRDDARTSTFTNENLATQQIGSNNIH